MERLHTGVAEEVIIEKRELSHERTVELLHTGVARLALSARKSTHSNEKWHFPFVKVHIIPRGRFPESFRATWLKYGLPPARDACFPQNHAFHLRHSPIWVPKLTRRCHLEPISLVLRLATVTGTEEGSKESGKSGAKQGKLGRGVGASERWALTNTTLTKTALANATLSRRKQRCIYP